MSRWFATLILLCWVSAVLLQPLLQTTPNQIQLDAILAPPSADFWLGNDALGRSVGERLLAGAEIALLVSVATVLISALAGTVIGAISGYAGGMTDVVISRIIDIMLAFPGILLAIALAAVLGPGIDNLVIAISVVGWVGYARLARAQALSLKQREHVSAAIALGSRQGRILRRHIIPLMLAPLLVEASFGIAAVIVAEAGLSFLGLGVQPPQASWGSMIREGADFLLVAPHLAIFPGIAIFLVVLSANLFGDWLRSRLDVREEVGRA
ncbi:MAG: ABC transporter permease [Sedimenticolaceae bacterium]|nr:ABC transporter permease [Sedimenticolaceae bacterium]